MTTHVIKCSHSTWKYETEQARDAAWDRLHANPGGTRRDPSCDYEKGELV